MVGRHIDRLADAVFPIFYRQSWYAVNEVYCDIVKAGLATSPEGGEGGTGIMAAVEHAEDVVVKGLNSDTEAVDAGVPQFMEHHFCQVFRICLQGDLGIGVKHIVSCHSAEQGVEFCR